MNHPYLPLNELKPGQSARVEKILCSGALRRRFLDLGLGPHTDVSCVGYSPSGDPHAFLIRGAVIAIRNRDSQNVLVKRPRAQEIPIALAGNPNVGKSTLFNALTGLRQHTGNWPGKTVEQASSTFRTAFHTYRITDTPGSYSLQAHSPEEEITRDFLCFGGAEAVVAVCSASCLERSLCLALQILELCPKTLVCVNLMDEAEERGIQIDLPLLSRELGVPATGISARSGQNLYAFSEALDRLAEGRQACTAAPIPYPPSIEAAIKLLEPSVQKLAGGLFPSRWLSLRLLEGDPALKTGLSGFYGFSLETAPSLEPVLQEAHAMLDAAGLSGDKLQDAIAESILARAEEIASRAVHSGPGAGMKKDRLLDRIFTSRLLGYPAMLLLLAFILWLTITGANYPSQLLSRLLLGFQGTLSGLFQSLGAPDWIRGLLVDGAYRVLAWVVSVMLPPMAIFFPLFTLLEDVGYLPRIAYNLDHLFQRCRSCGKQALTLCMSFGCNAVGVTGCRIIDSPRERLIAILTAGFIPCNGRFPALILLLSLILSWTASGLSRKTSVLSALLLTLLTTLAAAAALLASRLLSSTILRGLPSSFTLELPPYRKPQPGKILLRSLLDRTVLVLGRAVSAAAPAGALIWILANVRLGGASLLSVCSGFLHPFASVFGLDGAILLAFILGLPANEIVIPVMLAVYLNQGTLTEAGSLLSLRELLAAQGWTAVTALCTLIFMLFHWPCATTLLTIRKETGSLGWTLLAAALPAALGLGLCFLAARGGAVMMGAQPLPSYM